MEDKPPDSLGQESAGPPQSGDLPVQPNPENTKDYAINTPPRQPSGADVSPAVTEDPNDALLDVFAYMTDMISTRDLLTLSYFAGYDENEKLPAIKELMKRISMVLYDCVSLEGFDVPGDVKRSWYHSTFHIDLHLL